MRHAPEGQNSYQDDEDDASTVVISDTVTHNDGVPKSCITDGPSEEIRKCDNQQVFNRDSENTNESKIDDVNEESDVDVIANGKSSNPFSVLRSLKTPFQHLGDNLNKNSATCTDTEKASEKPKPAIEPFNFRVHRCSTNIKSFKATDFGDVEKFEPEDSNIRGRGRSRHKTRGELETDLGEDNGEDFDIGSVNKRDVKTYPSVAQYEYDGFAKHPRWRLDKVSLANEMWFGKYRAAFEGKDYRRARSVSPETLNSRSRKSERDRRKDEIEDDDGYDVEDGTDEISEYSRSGTGIGNGNVRAINGNEQSFDKNEDRQRGSDRRGKHGKGRSKQTAKEKRRRRVTISVDITSDLKEARMIDDKQTGDCEVNCQDGNIIKVTDDSNEIPVDSESDIPVTSTAVDVEHVSNSESDLERVTINHAPGKDGEHMHSSLSVSVVDMGGDTKGLNTPTRGLDATKTDASESTDKATVNSIVNMFESKANGTDVRDTTTENSNTHNNRLSARDRRKRNKTITGDIREDLAKARSAPGDSDNNKEQEITKEQTTYDERCNITSDKDVKSTVSGNASTNKRNRNRTISVDIKEFLKQARENYKDADDEETGSDDSVNGSVETSEHSGSNYENGIGNVETETMETSSNRREYHDGNSGDISGLPAIDSGAKAGLIRYPRLNFNKANAVSGVKDGEENASRGKDGKKRGEKRSHLEAATKFRIPSFEEMLYNK